MAEFDPSVYEQIAAFDVPEANGKGTLLRHRKSGARLFLLENDDENKVFSIAFRTPPDSDSGVCHIIEHSVLCGSEKYPVKDPFVELAKGSFNTFLNAMTYPDKTVYPVASCNDADFKNLMSVYMDAVFHPKMLENEKIFRQEGWHYELTDPEGELAVSGVVYNEMQGVFASPTEVLARYAKQELFPDTPYVYESGGDPDAIPDLSYEQFCDFHRKYYHPSNSYLYLYGNVDMTERLIWLDEEVLSHYEAKEIDSEIPLQKPFTGVRTSSHFYGVTPGEETKNKTFLSVQKVIGDALDVRLTEAFGILEYVLLEAPGAPLREALMNAGICEDVSGGCDAMRESTFEITASGAEAESLPEFERIVTETLQKVVKEGISKKTLLAAINISEFKAREADYGSTPKGLVYGLQCLDTWLYDDEKPADGMMYEDVYAFLRSQIDTGYFEELIEKYLLKNPNGIVMTLAPKEGLAEEKEAELADKLAKKKASMSEEEKQELIKNTEELQRWQEESDETEDLRKIPRLTLSDIPEDPMEIDSKMTEAGGVPVLYEEMFTGGISYLELHFDCAGVELKDLPVLGFLRYVLSAVDTASYSYGELTDEINIHTGGIDFGCGSYCVRGDTEHPQIFFSVNVSAMEKEMPEAVRLVTEILFTSDLSDEKRLAELLGEQKSRQKMHLTESGHAVAVLRAQSYFSPSAWVSEEFGGIDFYEFVKDWSEEKDLAPLVKKLQEVMGKIFCKENMTVSFTSDKSGLSALAAPLSAFAGKLPEKSFNEAKRDYPLEKKNEGFTLSSPVNYVAVCGDYRDGGFAYTGAMRVLQTMMGYDYLWNRLRVQGGAYGCMSGFSREGDSYFVSYRDPNLTETIEVYEQVPDYLENLSLSEEELEQYIIGTVSVLDTPLTAQAKGHRAMQMAQAGLTEEDLKKERTEILTATPKDIRALAGPMKAVLRGGYLCVVGNAGQITEEKDRFLNIRPLL